MDITKSKAEKRLSITRENELLQSFVRINVQEDSDDDEKSIKEVEGEANAAAEAGESRIRQAPMSAGTSTRLAKEITEDTNRKRGIIFLFNKILC